MSKKKGDKGDKGAGAELKQAGDQTQAAGAELKQAGDQTQAGPDDGGAAEEDMPGWKKARLDFARLPAIRQIETRVDNAHERALVHLQRLDGYKFATKDAGGNDVDAAEMARQAQRAAVEALASCRAWLRQIPDSVKPARAAASAAAPKAPPEVGATCRLRGAAAKAEPEYAKGTVVVLEHYGTAKSLRAKYRAPDGTKVACALHDLIPA